MLFLILVCLSLGLLSWNLVACGLAVVLWGTLHPLLVWMGKADPDMVGIYLRSRRYPGYIRPFTTPYFKYVGYKIRVPQASWKSWRN